MGVSIDIQAGSMEEFEALQSEGAPTAHYAYGNWYRVLVAFGVENEVDYECGSADPELFLDNSMRALRAAFEAEQEYLAGEGWVNLMKDRIEQVLKIAEAADALDRNVSWG
jgi:hypothetical protein